MTAHRPQASVLHWLPPVSVYLREMVAGRYQSCLREEPARPLPDEAFVQQLWFEEAYRNPLTTLSGEMIRIIQPGYLNHRAGPDFLQAVLVNGRGERETGAVEIHLRPADWHHHGHREDPRYDQTILHVIWNTGPRDFFPGTASGRTIRQVEFSSQLRLPLAQLRTLAASTPAERRAGARIGTCEKTLRAFRDAELMELLREAGWHRFQRKRARWAVLARLWGWDEALWCGLGECLGYADNKAPFCLLTRRLPVAQLRALTDPVLREALLYGVAGFLPARTLGQGAVRGWARTLWDTWWQHRDAHADSLIPPTHWKLQGLRPANRPERRLAVLPLLADPDRWPLFREAARQGDTRSLARQLTGLRHEFWTTHSTLRSAAGRPAALLGPARIQSFFFNVVWPLAVTPPSPDDLAHVPSGDESQPVRIARVRLLGTRRPRGLSSLLAREGLLQLYYDFCLQDNDRCARCSFPEFIERWQR